jgi:hypothetical protein
METQGDDFLSGILADGQVDGLGNLSIPNTPQETDNISDDLDMQVVGTKVKRAKNFNSDEDVIVCSAWLNASKDPLHGANQNRTRFWGRVLAYFNEHNKRNIPRSQSSIMHRWLIIQTQVNKFCSCYEAITRRNQSGVTIEDKVTHVHIINFHHLVIC